VAASVDALRSCRTIYAAAFMLGWPKRSESAKSRPIIRDADRLAGLFVATQDGSPLPDGTLVSIPEQTIGARVVNNQIGEAACGRDLHDLPLPPRTLRPLGLSSRCSPLRLSHLLRRAG
jgi:hypothetical protein